MKGGFGGFINNCIENQTMHLIEDYDESKWEFVDGKHYHITEERLLTKQILEAAANNTDNEEDEYETE